MICALLIFLLIDFELLEKSSKKVNNRPLLVNEFLLDIAGKTEEVVLRDAINIIDHAETLKEYEYTKPPKECFYSWVFSNGLR